MRAKDFRSSSSSSRLLPLTACTSAAERSVDFQSPLATTQGSGRRRRSGPPHLAIPASRGLSAVTVDPTLMRIAPSTPTGWPPPTRWRTYCPAKAVSSSDLTPAASQRPWPPRTSPPGRIRSPRFSKLGGSRPGTTPICCSPTSPRSASPCPIAAGQQIQDLLDAGSRRVGAAAAAISGGPHDDAGRAAHRRRHGGDPLAPRCSRAAASYDELVANFRWRIPPRFNIAACLPPTSGRARTRARRADRATSTDGTLDPTTTANSSDLSDRAALTRSVNAASASATASRCCCRSRSRPLSGTSPPTSSARSPFRWRHCSAATRSATGSRRPAQRRWSPMAQGSPRSPHLKARTSSNFAAIICTDGPAKRRRRIGTRRLPRIASHVLDRSTPARTIRR